MRMDTSRIQTFDTGIVKYKVSSTVEAQQDSFLASVHGFIDHIATYQERLNSKFWKDGHFAIDFDSKLKLKFSFIGFAQRCSEQFDKKSSYYFLRWWAKCD